MFVAGKIKKTNSKRNNSQKGEFVEVLIIENNLAGLETEEVIIGIKKAEKTKVKFIEAD